MAQQQLYRYKDYTFTGVSDLERVLNGPITEDTDVRIFLAAAKIDPGLAHYIEPFSREIRTYLEARWERHRATLDTSARRRSARLSIPLNHSQDDFETLAELRAYIGSKDYIPFPNCGPVSWNYFNSVLAQYGLQPMLYGKAYRIQQSLATRP